jgi:hypothetical protein
MTEEEKKERKKVQMREYMYRRRKEDPAFAEKLRENCRKHNQNNPNYNSSYSTEKRKVYNTEYYKAKKEKLKLLEELLAKSNIN